MTTSLPRRRLIAWAKDAAERAVRTYAQALVAVVAVTEQVSIEAFADPEAQSIAAGAAVLSVLTSLAARKTGSPTSARVRG